MTDQQALDLLADWMEDFDPTLDDDLPLWVWSLTALLDDVLVETGRLVEED